MVLLERQNAKENDPDKAACGHPFSQPQKRISTVMTKGDSDHLPDFELN